MKKRKGTLVDFLPSCIVIIGLTILMLSYLSIIEAGDTKKEADQLARKYILEMETVGYLSAESRENLLLELEELGIENIDLEGTTFSQAGYGNAVYLSLKCSIPANSLNTNSGDLLSYFFEDIYIPVEIKKMSTAKN